LTDFFSRVSFTRIEGGVSRLSKTAQYAKDKGKEILKRTGFYHYAKGITLTVLVCLTSCTIALAQKPTHPEADAKKESKPKLPFELTVKTRPILNISLKAEKAKVSEVTQELSKRLKVPIFLGTERQNELLTIEFSQLTLEPALQLMSPTVYVDYEISPGEQPKALGIYLYDANQGEPPLTAVVNGSNQSMLIEGNTEDGVEPAPEGDEKEKPLQIHFKDNLLTVKAKKQPLSLVLLKIGEELGIPVDIQELTSSIIDADISKLPVEEAVRQLSPNIRLFLRADLTRAERRALRLVLAEPAKTTQQNP
jgi:hypothetical protein